jgi:hypothetical protein
MVEKAEKRGEKLPSFVAEAIEEAVGKIWLERLRNALGKTP